MLYYNLIFFIYFFTIYYMDIELSSTSKIHLYLYLICPNIDIIKYIYEMKTKIEDTENINWYCSISPLYYNIKSKEGPRLVVDINTFNNRLNIPLKDRIPNYYYWKSIYGRVLEELIICSHQYFLCKFNRSQEEIKFIKCLPRYSTTEDIYDNIALLINEPQKETSIFERIDIYNKYYINLFYNENRYTVNSCCDECLSSICYDIIYDHYHEYTNIKKLYVTPCGLDTNGKLLYDI